MTEAPVPLAAQIEKVQREIRYAREDHAERGERLWSAILATLQQHERLTAGLAAANERIARLEGGLTFARDRMRGFVGGAYTKRECTHGIDTNGEDCPDCIDAYFMEVIDHIAAISPAGPG